jgi:hypothetical protein
VNVRALWPPAWLGPPRDLVSSVRQSISNCRLSMDGWAHDHTRGDGDGGDDDDNDGVVVAKRFFFTCCAALPLP